MAPKPRTNSKKRGLLRTILGKPYNSKIFSKKVPATGGVVGKKFSPTAGARNLNTRVPDLQGKSSPPVDDGSYSVASGGKGKFKKVTYYNKDGKRVAPPKRN